MSAEFPPIAELLPQAGAMRLLERVIAHDDERTRCEVLPSRSALFQQDGRIPAWVAIEYMAQCAAADGTLRLRARGEAPRPALFVGSRRIAFRCASFEPGQRLIVSARHVAGRRDLLAFECAVEDPAGGEPLVAGRLNVLPLREDAWQTR
jgi:predicted hotdog family 3-hydroxylacyl-ACP dehydratase